MGHQFLLPFLRLLRRFAGEVALGDVDEALRLMRQSKASLLDNGQGGDVRREDSVTLCYR